MTTVFCLDCEGAISLGSHPRVGQRIVCVHCEAELEVIEVSPLEIDWAFDEPVEDWDDDEEDGWQEDDEEDEWQEDDEEGGWQEKDDRDG